jgi:hypothetical protein
MKGAPMAQCNNRTNALLRARQVSDQPNAELHLAAERELAAFYSAVLEMYGPEEARRAGQDWIEEMEKIDRSASGVLPDWRHAAIVAADSLASRVVNSSVSH